MHSCDVPPHHSQSSAFTYLLWFFLLDWQRRAMEGHAPDGGLPQDERLKSGVGGLLHACEHKHVPLQHSARPCRGRRSCTAAIMWQIKFSPHMHRVGLRTWARPRKPPQDTRTADGSTHSSSRGSSSEGGASTAGAHDVAPALPHDDSPILSSLNIMIEELDTEILQLESQLAAASSRWALNVCQLRHQLW